MPSEPQWKVCTFENARPGKHAFPCFSGNEQLRVYFFLFGLTGSSLVPHLSTSSWNYDRMPDLDRKRGGWHAPETVTGIRYLASLIFWLRAGDLGELPGHLSAVMDGFPRWDLTAA